MAKFAIYQYMFGRITQPIELPLFENYDEVDVKESWKHKQKLFQDVLNENLEFRDEKGALYLCEIIKVPNQPEITLLRIGNNSSIELEKDLGKKRVKQNPCSLVIIDNRENLQRIAIEERKTNGAFSVYKLSGIIERAFKKLMKVHRLTFDLVPKKYSKAVWKILDANNGKICEMEMSFLHPNLPDISKMFDVMDGIYTTSVEFNCNPSLFLRALPGQTLNIDLSSIRLKSLISVCAATGQPIKIKTTDNKTFECFTRTTSRDIVLETLEIKRQELNEIAHVSKDSNVFAKIIMFVNNIKTTY